MDFINYISAVAIPAIILLVLSFGQINRVKVYEAFVEGAREGLTMGIKIAPYLIAMVLAIGIFRGSGALDIIIYVLKPVTGIIGIPSEVLPLGIMRPLSGSGSLAMVADIVARYGPDSFIGRLASTMMGSTETTFYTLAIYFGAVGIKKTRYVVAAALMADAAGIIMSVVICRIIFM